MEEVFGVVYLIQNQINGKRYVGKTTQTLKQRMTGHLYGNLCVDKAIEKYEIENFRYGIIKTCATEAELNAAERHFIIVLKTKAPYGYNLTDGGDGASGWKHTPEACAKISAALTGRPKSPEHQAKIVASNLGKKRTPEHCAKIVAALTGLPKSPEHCAKVSAAKRHYSPYKNLLAELDARQMSYTALTKLLGFATTSVISFKIRGIKNFTERDKAKLVEIFGKSIEYLLAREENTDCENLPAPKRNSPYQNLVAELLARKMSYTALAKLLGLSYSPVCARMRGEIPFNDSDKAKLVEIFGKPIEYLLARDE